jgi:drug/metabolite transporter (DMT)-like permease
MARGERIAAYGAWAAVCFFWGTTYLAIRVGLETLPPMLFAGMRFMVAGALVLLFMRAWRGARLPRGREWFDVSVVGLMLLGVGTGLVVWSEQWVPSGAAALLVATSPFWVAGLERARHDGERSSPRAILGMVVGFSGLVLLVAPSLFGSSLNGQYILGMLALQLACASWSAGSVYAKHHQVQIAPMMSAAVQMLVAGAALMLIGSIVGEWSEVRFSARSLSAFVYLIIFGSIVAYGSYTYAIQKLPLSIVSTYSYINPVIAVLLGWLVLSEPLGWRVICATAIILGGVALVKTAPKHLHKTEVRPAELREPGASREVLPRRTAKAC